MKCDVCIIGAGPAGLMVGIRSAGEGASTVIVESNTIAGRKLLKTGRGRCNLTHVGSIDDFVTAYGKYGRFLKHSLYGFTPEDVRGFFAEKGLATEVGKDGCVFPVTNRAADVKRILEDTARRLNVRFMYGKRVETIERQAGGFVTVAGIERIHSSCIVIATGGVSWPFTGSTGDGYGFAEAFGHRVFKPAAALVPLVTKEKWPGKLQGVGIAKAQLSGEVSGRKITSAGPLMFTGDGIGGPVSQDFSREIADCLAECSEGIEVYLDMMPDTDEAGLDRLIVDECGKHSRKELAGVLAVFLPRAMSIFLCDQIKPAGQILVSQFTKAGRAKLVRMIKSMPLTIGSARPIEEATVTRGGVDADEINDKTMESKLCKGLFFAGEVIDADGPCGGYNLQICWSTGSLAGKSAAEKIKK